MTSSWYDDYAEDADEIQIEEYDITAAPNDFNVITIFNFLESGAVRIPGFQRNYVWDISRASRLIESLILGLPVPQVFLYEIERNRFLVVDGQQRLMSIYYFIKQRFPKKEKRGELRSIFDLEGSIPNHIIHNDEYFDNFRLKLPESLPEHPNRFQGLNYATLESYRTQFELRTIRNVIIKQNSPKEDDSSMFEIFNRLNTGGINLKPQEIRISMYHSKFYEKLFKLNTMPEWRRVLKNPEPDIHMKDIEIILRGFALLMDISNYAPSMVKFLNQYSKKCKTHTPEQNNYLSDLFTSFITASKKLPEDIFINEKNNRFNVALFEAVFVSSSKKAFIEQRLLTGVLNAGQIRSLANDKKFIEATIQGTTRTRNVMLRLEKAEQIIGAL